MHECPHCGSKTITCRHCSWTWNPRDPENLPDTCPRCRCDWTKPHFPSIKYGHGSTLDPSIKMKPLSFDEIDKLKKKLKLDMRERKRAFKPKIENVEHVHGKKHLNEELSV